MIKPLFDKVVLKAIATEDRSAGGIVLPSVAKEKPQVAEVVAVGPGGIVDGKEIAMQVKVGDKVLYSKYSGSDFKLNNEEVTIVRQSDILAIID